MSTPVTLHVRTESYQEDDDDGLLFDGNKIIGEVRRGDTVLHWKEVITDDAVESVCGVRELVEFEITQWAIEHTDFALDTEAVPS